MGSPQIAQTRTLSQQISREDCLGLNGLLRSWPTPVIKATYRASIQDQKSTPQSRKPCMSMLSPDSIPKYRIRVALYNSNIENESRERAFYNILPRYTEASKRYRRKSLLAFDSKVKQVKGLLLDTTLLHRPHHHHHNALLL